MKGSDMHKKTLFAFVYFWDDIAIKLRNQNPASSPSCLLKSDFSAWKWAIQLSSYCFWRVLELQKNDADLFSCIFPWSKHFNKYCFTLPQKIARLIRSQEKIHMLHLLSYTRFSFKTSALSQFRSTFHFSLGFTKDCLKAARYVLIVISLIPGHAIIKKDQVDKLHSN